MNYNEDEKFANMLRWQNYFLWLQRRFSAGARHPVVNRGDIYACYLGENIGYEKSSLAARPCLVVSSDAINHGNGNIIVVPLSKTIKYDKQDPNKLRFDFHYVLKASKYALICDSAAQFEDIRSISKVRLGKYIDHIDPNDMTEIRKRIKSALQA